LFSNLKSDLTQDIPPPPTQPLGENDDDGDFHEFRRLKTDAPGNGDLQPGGGAPRSDLRERTELGRRQKKDE